MAQSINTRVDVVVEATSYQGLTNYGKIMVGDKGYTIRTSGAFFKLF